MNSKQDRPVIWLAEPEDFCTEARALMESKAEVRYGITPAISLKEVFSNCDAFFFRLGFQIQEEDLSENQRCRFIACPVTGLDHIDTDTCSRYGIKIISLKGERDFLSGIRATAEHTFALMLASLRRLVPACESVRSGIFNRDLFRGQELFHKTLGIVGYGRLGRQVARYALAFEMNVMACDVDPEQTDYSTPVVFSSLDHVLSHADIISIHVDFHEGNRHFVNRSFLEKMKRGAILINTSRGGIVDEDALVDALESGQLSSAALDVIEGEPHPKTDTRMMKYLRKQDNLIITPHIGGNTYESFEKTELFIVNKLLKALDHA